MGNTQNIKIGACKVLYKGVEIGHTKGGVTLTYTPEFSKITADQWGETPLDYSLNGEEWQITLRLTEAQIANLKKMFPMGTLAGNSDGRLTMGKNAGSRLLSEAGQLILHPLANSDTDASEDVVFYKAVAFDEVEVEYNNEDQRVYEVPFIALVDTTKANGSWLGHIGDSTD